VNQPSEDLLVFIISASSLSEMWRASTSPIHRNSDDFEHHFQRFIVFGNSLDIPP
jgi:hypothetical protein